VESPIQTSRKGWVFLREMDQIGGSALIEGVPAFFEAPGNSRFWKFLPGKDQNYIPAFVAERHSVGE
jgi:hypothetical protein